MKFLLNIFHVINFAIKFLFGNSVDEKKILNNLFKNESMIYFDVGANLGSNTKLLKKIFGKNLEVHAFEPSRVSYKKLKKYHPDIILNNVAVSNFVGKSNFFERSISSQSSMNIRENHPLKNVKNEYSVEVITLDQYIQSKNINKINFLKIDTEGDDFKVLQGAINILKNIEVNLIKVECLFNSNNLQDESEFNKIFNLLSSLNYKIYSIPNIKHINNKLYLMDIYFINNEFEKKYFEK